MGMFDTFFKNQADEDGVQLKNGDCLLNNYHIGDQCPDYPDGMIFGYNGAVLIRDGVVKDVIYEKEMIDKRGYPYKIAFTQNTKTE